MKRELTTLSLCAALLLAAAGCSSNAKPAATDTAASVSETKAPETTSAEELTVAVEDDEDSEETESAETEAAEDNSERNVIASVNSGYDFYEDEIKDKKEWGITFDKALVRISNGYYTDSEKNPDSFIFDEYRFEGETPENDNYIFVKEGDKVGGYTITNPGFTFQTYENEGVTNYMFMENTFEIAEKMELTGTLVFYANEQYTISSGDVEFIADESYKNLPCALLTDNFGGWGTGYTTFFCIDDNGNIYGNAVCSDSPRFRLGNLFDDYSADEQLAGLITDTSGNSAYKVKITLSDVRITYSEQFGGRAYAKIASVEPV